MQSPIKTEPLPQGIPLKAHIKNLKREVRQLKRKLEKIEDELKKSKKSYTVAAIETNRLQSKSTILLKN